MKMTDRVRCYIAHTFKHRKFVKEVLTPRLHAIGIDTKNPFYEPDGTTKRPEVALADKADIQGLSTSDIAKDVSKVSKSNGYSEISLQEKEKEKWIQMVRAKNKQIVKRDLHFINGTDFTVAYLTDLSAGTCCEIFWTGVVKKRPVFLICDNPELTMHPWIMYSCKKGKIVKNIDELIRVLKRKYG
jgi:nucleoside 2-deoxyribosyltransferase